MARWSFGLRHLFFWTAAIALGLVALRSANTVWVGAMLLLALAALTASVLLVVFRRGAARAYWIGFATAGWLYVLLLLASWTLARLPADDNPLQAYNLLTQQLASAAYHWLYDEAFAKYENSLSMGARYYPQVGVMGGGYDAAEGMSSAAGDEMMMGDPYGSSGMMPGYSGSMGPPLLSGPPTPSAPPGPSEIHFVNVAHSLWTLLFAALGGCLAWWLFVTGPDRQQSPATAS